MKRIIALSCVVLLMLSLASCEAAKAKSVEKTGSLTIAVDNYDWGLALKGIFARFEKEHPEIEVKYEIIPDIVTDENFLPMRETVIKRLHTQLMAGVGPDIYIDILHPYSNRDGMEFLSDVQLSMESGVFCDMTPYLEAAGVNMDDFIAPVMEAGQIDGKQCIVPLHYETSYILTNDLSRERLGGDEAFKDVTRFTENVLNMSQAPDTFAKTYHGYGRWHANDGRIEYIFNPLYFSGLVVDYNLYTASVDTEFVRDMLINGKAIRDNIVRNYVDDVIDVPTEETWAAWNEYVASDKYAVISKSIEGTLTDAGYMEHVGLTPHIEPIPSDDGGVNALITMYAAVCAGSEHKQEAAELIKLFLSEELQRVVSYSSGDYLWPVRKGLLPEIADKYVNVGLDAPTNHKIDNFYFEHTLSAETVAQYQAIEDSITSARFPLPVEAIDILCEYYAGERDIDSTIADVQWYMGKSLWAAS